jgi:hypothetical protein
VFYNNVSRGSPDFTSTGANPGRLSSRPDRYVPFLVPVFDEEATEIRRQAYREALADNPGAIKPEPFYRWCYRPEMQYSLYDLDISAINRQIDETTSENILESDSIISCEDDWAEILYSLSTTELLPIDYIDLAGDKELVFTVGGQEVTATIGSDQSIRFDNLAHLALLDAEDFLTIRLATNNDAGNVLWEYALIDYLGFVDQYPDRACNEPGGSYDNGDSDNFFLRQDGDYQNLDIYYWILPEDLVVMDARVNIYRQTDELDEQAFPPIAGEKIAGTNTFKTGKGLHICWPDVRDADGAFRDAGFYRLELVVTILKDGHPLTLHTPINDGDETLPGWQCPPGGLAVHDLVYKHRPDIYVGAGEDVARNGPVHPFSEAITGRYRLLKDNTLIDGPVWEGDPTENYSGFGTFPHESLSDTHTVLQASVAHDCAGVEDHYLDIDNENRGCTDGDPYLLHRSHTPATHPNYVFVHYWMYETCSHTPYNSIGLWPNNIYWHEADWEMVQIAIQLRFPEDISDKSRWIMPYAATASQHYYGQTLAWRLDNSEETDDVTAAEQRYVATTEDGNRIKIYIAENSHAIYFRSGRISTPESEKGVGIQDQYDMESYAYDMISNPLPRGDYFKLLTLEDYTENMGVYDWEGKWGEQRLEGPMYRQAKDESGSPFRLDANPVYFHQRCCKLVDSEGFPNENGQPDELTELR